MCSFQVNYQVLSWSTKGSPGPGHYRTSRREFGGVIHVGKMSSFAARLSRKDKAPDQPNVAERGTSLLDVQYRYAMHHCDDGR